MDSSTYWFVISPLGAVVTVIIAFTLADGIWRWYLLGVAVTEALPLVLLGGWLALLSFLSDDVA